MPLSLFTDKEILTGILDSLNVGVVFMDKENRIAFVNKEAERIRRMKSEERLGTSILECHSGAMHKRVQNVIDDFRRGVKTTRHRMVKTFGRAFDNTYSVVVDSEGNYQGLVLVGQDVTEKLALEEQLKKTNAELENKVRDRTREIKATYEKLRLAEQQLLQAEKMASIGQFVSGVAHEINNPLDGIQNCIRAVLGEPENRDQLGRYLPLALEGLFRIELLVRQLLDFARPHDFERQPLLVNDIIEHALSLTQFKIKEKGISLHSELAANLPPISGGPHYLPQVFVNIILNAIDAMNTGGFLTVETKAVGKSAAVTVSDTGCGISPIILKKIFDPFFSTKPSHSGTGLGLYLSYNVITSLGGTIRVKSTVGKGSRFTVLLPAADAGLLEDPQVQNIFIGKD